MNSIKVKNILKNIGWTLLALVGTMSVIAFCAVRYLESKQLAPMAEKLAADYIDGDVRIENLRIGFHPGFPFLQIKIDSLTVVSHAFDKIPEPQRGIMPDFADSLLSVDHISGTFDIKRLIFNNELSLRDVAISGLSVNFVIAHNGKANYEVFKTDNDSTSDKKKHRMPSFSINRFSLEKPKEIRFFNAADSTSASVVLLSEVSVDGHERPTYRLKINGNFTSPKATLLTNLDRISFGANGKVHWDPTQPGLVAMDEMELSGAFVKAIVSGEMDLTANPIVRKGSVMLAPVAITDLLSLLPDSVLLRHQLKSPFFSTDAAIEGNLKLTEPMNLATDTFPSALVNIRIKPSTLRHGKSQLSNISLDATVKTLSNSPDSTYIKIKRFTIDGLGTNFSASAAIATPVSDPSFKADIHGKIDLSDLPLIAKENIPGYLAGVISTDIHASGTVSMIRPEQIHRIVANGDIRAKNMYFLAADTSKMVEIGNAHIRIMSGLDPKGSTNPNVNLTVDTATVLVSGIDLAFADISLGLRPELNPRAKVSQTDRMKPLAGILKVKRFNIITVKDSAGAKIRTLDGKIHFGMKPGDGFNPVVSADITTGSVSAGTRKDRIIIDGAKIVANLDKMSSKEKFDKDERSSLRKPHRNKEYSYISPSAVHRYVYEKRIHGKKTRRVYIESGSDGDQVLVWNLTRQFRNFLNTWGIRGSVKTNRARLTAGSLKLPNEISAMDIRFSNDTVSISDITMKAGKSDLAFSGLITNVSDALTMKSDKGLKGNISLRSDYIDINELSSVMLPSSSDKSDGKRIGNILIPVNLDTRVAVKSKRISYGDLDMTNAGGDILIFDGGVNLHDIKANSHAGDLSVTALYSAPRADDIHFGFAINAKDFNIGELVKLIPAIDSITPLMHDFSGIVGADIAATCMIDSGMNINLPSLNAAVRITGDNLAFIDPEKYRTLGKWLGFKDKSDNTIHRLNVEMTVEDGLLRVYPFAFDIDRYRLGIYGSNNIDMDFDYHLSVLKSPLPFRFGITIKGNPKKYKVRFGGAKFKENTAIESVNIVNEARINLIDQIEDVFRRGVRNSKFAKLKVNHPSGFAEDPEAGLTSADSLQMIEEGILDAPVNRKKASQEMPKKKRKRFLFF